MVETWVVSAVLEAATALAAGLGAFRLRRLDRLVGDPRIRRLGLFFALAAAATLVHLVGVLVWERRPDVVARDASFELLDILFWTHHALLLGAIAAAVAAYGPAHRAGPPIAVVAPVLLVAEPLLRILESLGFLYLLVRTLLNHVRKTSLGSLQVALGYFAVLVGHALFLVNGFAGPDPLGARDPAGEALVLVGFLVLALSTPGGRLRRG